MSTQIVTLVAGQWTAIVTGPTTDPVCVEKQDTGGMVWLATGSAIPTFTAAGHALRGGDSKMVGLAAGETLYAWAVDDAVHVPVRLAVT